MQPWPQRKKKDRTPARRAILLKSGNLRQAATASGRVQGNQVIFTVPLVYANVHNSDDPADRQAGRGKGFTMPQRKFIGDTPALDKRIADKAQRLLDEELKKLAQ